MKKHNIIKLGAILAGIALSGTTVAAQVVIGGGSTYNQNFDTPNYATEVAAAGSQAAWSYTNADNNTAYQGWFRQVSVGGQSNRDDKDFIGEKVNGTTIRFANVGNGGTYAEPTTDRALMSLIRGAGGEVSFGVVFQVSGTGVAGIDVSFTGEQWFRAPNANTLEFQYKVLSSFDAGTYLINDETGWTDANTLDFAALKVASGQAINGNFDGDSEFGPNNVALSDSIALSASDGQYIALRWRQVDVAAGVAQPGLAVDDLSVTFTAVPEPATFALLAGFATLGLVLYRRRNA
jgi:hypothetical protein